MREEDVRAIVELCAENNATLGALLREVRDESGWTPLPKVIASTKLALRQIACDPKSPAQFYARRMLNE